ncbi:glycoside hydrolase [Streptomyces sp. NBC_00487]|uniref:sialidase family protein n=2 Tax=Streptomyces TaxID=1883 RepID=UPI002E17A56F
MRQSMSVWRGDNAGAAFTKSTTFSQRPAAYSDLVPLGRTHVGVLYETGPYETIEFRRLPPAACRLPPAACRLPLSGLLG